MITYQEMLELSEKAAVCDRFKELEEMEQEEMLHFLSEEKSLKKLCQQLAEHGVHLEGGTVPYLGSDMPPQSNMSMRLLAREPVYLDGKSEPAYFLYAGCWIDDIYFAHYVWWRV